MEAQSNQSSATASNERAISIFISHSSKDIELAEAMTELMRLGIALTEEDIRCTSVDGYRFEVGAETDTQLKRELKNSKAFIGLITPSSIQSAYVLFELGARWGADLHLAPVLARGADAESLRGPLKILNALQATEEPQMHQLVQDIARRIERTPKSPAVYGRALGKLIVAAGKVESAANQSGSAMSKLVSSIPTPTAESRSKSKMESGPRTISFDQESEIIKLLKGVPLRPIWITTRMGSRENDREAHDYAMQLTRVFMKAGVPIEGQASVDVGTLFPNGVSIFWKKAIYNDISASSIIEAVRITGVECKEVERQVCGSHKKEPEINLMIGSNEQARQLMPE